MITPRCRNGCQRKPQEERPEERPEERLGGRLEEARELLLRVGARRFGEPPAPALERLNAIDSIALFEQLIERALAVESWSELLPG